MIVSVFGGSSRFVSGDMTLGHKFNSCLSLALTPRSRSDGETFNTSITKHYLGMTDRMPRGRLAAASAPDALRYQLILWKFME